MVTVPSPRITACLSPPCVRSASSETHVPCIDACGAAEGLLDDGERKFAIAMPGERQRAAQGSLGPHPPVISHVPFGSPIGKIMKRSVRPKYGRVREQNGVIVL